MSSVNERTETLLMNMVIASGQTKTAPIENPKMALVGFITPATLTGTSFSFEGSVDGSTYYPIHKDDGTVYTVPVAASRYTFLPPYNVCGWQYIKIVSNSAEGAARTIIGIFRVL